MIMKEGQPIDHFLYIVESLNMLTARWTILFRNLFCKNGILKLFCIFYEN